MVWNAIVEGGSAKTQLLRVFAEQNGIELHLFKKDFPESREMWAKAVEEQGEEVPEDAGYPRIIIRRPDGDIFTIMWSPTYEELEGAHEGSEE